MSPVVKFIGFLKFYFKQCCDLAWHIKKVVVLLPGVLFQAAKVNPEYIILHFFPHFSFYKGYLHGCVYLYLFTYAKYVCGLWR